MQVQASSLCGLVVMNGAGKIDAVQGVDGFLCTPPKAGITINGRPLRQARPQPGRLLRAQMRGERGIGTSR